MLVSKVCVEMAICSGDDAMAKEKKITHRRLNLINARKKAGYTQVELADLLYISSVHYRYIEYGLSDGRIDMWDKLEDLFGIHQRVLRETFKIERVKR